MTIYVIKLGGNLYVENKMYGLFQSTTTNLLNAHWFIDKDEAEAKARKMINATIEEYELVNTFEVNSEIDTLKSALAETRRQRDEAIEKYNKLKGEH